MNGTMNSEIKNRDPKFYSELKQTNNDLLKFLEVNQKKSPYFDYTETLQSYMKLIADLKEQYPAGHKAAEAKLESKTLFSIAHQQDNNSSFVGANRTLLNETNKTIDASKVEETGEDGEAEDAAPPEPNVDKYEESDAKYQCKCKLYERVMSKLDGPQPPRYVGSGELFVKDMETPGKLHVIMRQDPDLRKVLLNQVITSSVPAKLLTRAVQFLGPPTTDEDPKFNVIKVRDDKIASELFANLRA